MKMNSWLLRKVFFAIFIPLPLMWATFSVADDNEILDDPSNEVTISNVWNGYVLTIFATADNQYLWAYYPPSTDSWDRDLPNWKVLYRSDSQLEHQWMFLQSLYKPSNCMEVYNNSRVVHNRCSNSDIQDFELLPTTSGAVQIKSISTRMCLLTPEKSSGFSNKVELGPCATPGEFVSEHSLWTLRPVRRPFH